MTTTNDTTTKSSYHVHTTHAGEKPMKTTKKSQSQNDHATSEGATAMTTESTTTTTEAAPAATANATTALRPSTLAYIAQCSALLDQFDAAFPKGDALTATDKKRMAKARKGSERYTPQIVTLAREHGVNVASLPLDVIESASAEAAALVPLQKKMERLHNRLSAHVFGKQSTSWGGSSKLYAVLKRLSKDDGELATGLEPVEQYFNHRHPLVAKGHPKTKKGKEALKAEKAAAAEVPAATAPATAPPETPAHAGPAAETPGAGGATHA